MSHLSYPSNNKFGLIECPKCKRKLSGKDHYNLNEYGSMGITGRPVIGSGILFTCGVCYAIKQKKKESGRVEQFKLDIQRVRKDM